VRQTLFFIVFIFVINSFSQTTLNKIPIGIPFKQSFTPKDYDAGPQNWAIAQDKQGSIYVGNSFGILQFDGVDWRKIETPIGSDVYSLAVDTFGIVFAGLTNGFGYLSAGWDGNPVYISLSDSIEGFFGQVFKIIPLHDDVYFVTENHRIFKYNGKTVHEIINAKIDFAGKLNSNIIVQKRDKSIYLIENDSLVKIPNLDKIAHKWIVAVFPYLPDNKSNKQNLIITSDGIFYIYNGKTLKTLQTETTTLFKKYYKIGRASCRERV